MLAHLAHLEMIPHKNNLGLKGVSQSRIQSLM